MEIVDRGSKLSRKSSLLSFAVAAFQARGARRVFARFIQSFGACFGNTIIASKSRMRRSGIASIRIAPTGEASVPIAALNAYDWESYQPPAPPTEGDISLTRKSER